MPQTVLITLAFNLLPVGFAVLFGWSLLSLMLLYWAENVIVGLINVLKMIVAASNKGPTRISGLFLSVPFFIVHYGLFCAVHGVLILVLFNGEPTQTVNDPWDIPAVFWQQIHINAFFALNLLLLATFHLYRFVMEWLWTGVWRTTDPYVQMFMPYGRIIVVHIAVLVGGFLATFIGSPTIAVVILALLKTVLEVSAAQINLPQTALSKR
jgi:hypothetical protein